MIEKEGEYSLWWRSIEGKPCWGNVRKLEDKTVFVIRMKPVQVYAGRNNVLLPDQLGPNYTLMLGTFEYLKRIGVDTLHFHPVGPHETYHCISFAKFDTESYSESFCCQAQQYYIPVADCEARPTSEYVDYMPKAWKKIDSQGNETGASK